MKLKAAIRLLLGVSSSVTLASPAIAQDGSIDEIIVTAQKRQENIQDVPIAVSAFSGTDLEEKRLDGAYDLQNSVPNLVFTGGTGSTPNFNIRGVGSGVGIGSTGDSGVLPHHNNVPLTISRTGVADFYDVERVEVLRGPQGTLYGRNATGGVINVITAKPDLSEFSASTTAEVANHNTRKAKAHVNLPLGEMFGLRIAGSYLKRDGYTENLDTGNDIDSRDLWSARATLAFEPTDNFRAYLLFERFEEDDTRNGGAKTLCIKDPGPTSVGGVPVNNPRARNFLSRGCLQGSIYQDAAFGTVNSVATFGGLFSERALLTSGDTFAGQTTDRDLRKVSYYQDPTFDAINDLIELEAQWDITSGLTLSLLGSYTSDESIRIGGSEQSEIGFRAIPGLTPGGIFNDPQGGPGDGVRTLTYNTTDDIQRTAELRLQSDLDGALNFNVGVFALDLDRFTETFTSTNATNAFRLAVAANPALGYIDMTPGIPVSGDGHNYFYVKTPYELESQAAFGEVYWQMTDSLKLTVGARYTEDSKSRIYYPVNLFAPTGQGGVVGAPGWDERLVLDETQDSSETTGRVTLDWQAADNTLVYATFGRGYKAGGFNSPILGASSPPFASETVNAFEVGTKNIFLDGSVQLNATAFMYDYKDYQFSKIDGFASIVDNLDVDVRGVEIEATWAPIQALVFNAAFGYLDTEIQKGESIDPFDRTQGNPDLTYVKSIQGGCVVNTAAFANVISAINAGTLSPEAVAGYANICSTATPSPLVALYGLNAQPGAVVNLEGNELPNSPEWTLSVGAQYTLALGGAWDATLRADYYKQADSYASHFNSADYQIQGWDNYNASIIFRNVDWNLDVQLYGKNLSDDDKIVDLGVNSEQLGLTRGVQLLEPRLFGLSLTKRW